MAYFVVERMESVAVHEEDECTTDGSFYTKVTILDTQTGERKVEMICQPIGATNPNVWLFPTLTDLGYTPNDWGGA